MSHMTADLEYFKCDMCGVYMHRDIFCDHRRDCHGRDSTMLKRGECAKLSEALGRETRELLLAREAAAGAPRAANESMRQSSPGHSRHSGGKAAESGEGAAQCRDRTGRPVEAECAVGSSEQTSEAGTTTAEAAPLPNGSLPSPATVRNCDPSKISAALSVAELERRQEARTRRAVSDRYQGALDAKLSALLTDEKKAALLNFLHS
ncbi:hypothetical protein ABL78_6446 [Leptomonas seymouri]|uniref:Uncharacterized protein n=1 Tax=Leptomonas seymouri TaxID=5684 RepID=A0A0N1II80_LEPSE|nr:hypothetical protein ABL78_6446 [Leptomonas seymouri]|eukprot:KPI84511.1 hypothetical protein ABL78_6446 [Leptomonas seymouri]